MRLLGGLRVVRHHDDRLADLAVEPFEQQQDLLAGDPVEVAKRYNDQGADELCFLDITASVEARGLLYGLIERVASQVFIPLTVGGGVKTAEDLRPLLNAGADKVSINTTGVNNPQIFNDASHFYGAQCVVASIDSRRSASGW